MSRSAFCHSEVQGRLGSCVALLWRECSSTDLILSGYVCTVVSSRKKDSMEDGPFEESDSCVSEKWFQIFCRIGTFIGMRSSLFWDITHRRLVVTDVSGQHIGPKGQAVQEACFPVSVTGCWRSAVVSGLILTHTVPGRCVCVANVEECLFVAVSCGRCKRIQFP